MASNMLLFSPTIILVLCVRIFIKEKSDVTRATEKFLADTSPYGKVKTLSFHEDIYPSGEIKHIRSDNGGEFTSKEFQILRIKMVPQRRVGEPCSRWQDR